MKQILPPSSPLSHLTLYRNLVGKKLGAGLGLAGALDLSGLGAVDVVGGDPVSVVGGGGGNSRAGSLLNSGSLSTLGRAGGTLLGGLAALALLGEVGGDPDGVEEVDNSSKAGQEEEVEEDARETTID